MIAIVMGVEGSGKTTVGELLAEQLGWEYTDGDSFHPAANVEKMKHGTPLNDSDRAPWLGAIHDAVVQWMAEERNMVLSCSALKRAYREQIGVGSGLQWVYLKGSYELILRRLQSRHGHFAKPELLASQFEALEEPQQAIPVNIDATPEKIVDEIHRQMKAT